MLLGIQAKRLNVWLDSRGTRHALRWRIHLNVDLFDRMYARTSNQELLEYFLLLMFAMSRLRIKLNMFSRS